MPEDVGGTPFPDGWEPDDDHDRGVSDEEFASVVFDEAFVRAAEVHEPTAVERLLAAAQARAEAEAHRARTRGDRYGGYRGDSGYDDPDDAEDVLEGDYGSPGPYGRPVRWHRPVAWMLALVMGIGMVALAFSAVYRGASSHRQDPAPPATTGVEQGGTAVPSASADYSQPAVPVIPRGSP
ncbi:SCO2584 family spore wall biosynthesis protein [Streptomyces pimonensis]|uniref:SCO2584 family spore wall biosynthesis protein n=1 Tax=Streptomyces pimonensis TaxID=2860288 RepID=UPI003FA0C677